METPRTLEDFLNLVPSANNGKPKFMAIMQLLLEPLIALREKIDTISLAYDLDQAVGAQLDVVGEWVGLSRKVQVPLEGVFFSFGIEGLGWGEGVWKGPFDPTTGLVLLPDADYRRFLRAKIGCNHWDGTLEQMLLIWQSFFEGLPDIVTYIQDNQDMSIVLGAGGAIPPILRQLIITRALPLKPAGVRVNYALANGPLFAFGLDTDALKGWGEGYWAEIF